MTGRQAFAKIYGEGAMVSHAALGCAIKIVDGRVVDQDCNPIPVYLRAWFVVDLESDGWFEVEKPKVVANGLKELFEKDDGKMKNWEGEDGVRYFIAKGDSGAKRIFVVESSFPVAVTESFVNQKFTLEDKQ